MPKKKESGKERATRIARLKELYDSGRIEEVLIPENADVRRLVDDIASGTSDVERRLAELLKVIEEG